MIRQIWIRIAALLGLAVIPLLILQLKLQEDGIKLIYSLADRTEIRPTLDQYLNHLREDARKTPEFEGLFKEEFLKVSKTKQALEGFFLAQDSIFRDIRYQTISISLGVLAISLLGSLLISRGIVKRAQELMDERAKAATKLRDLHALQNWQNIAKILVHELRAPMTPIKLVVSDLAFKKKTLSEAQFDRYIDDAQKLMSEQVEAIEGMIGGFTVFGKLPSPQFQDLSIHTFLGDFIHNYGQTFGENVQLRLHLSEPDRVRSLDGKLLRDLFFNLCKNAAEANQGSTEITLSYKHSGYSDQILIHNSGASIPDALVDSLFDPYVSSKGGSNMGLGLAIARKIALDHQGDLTLYSNQNGVTFQLDLPYDPSTKGTIA